MSVFTFPDRQDDILVVVRWRQSNTPVGNRTRMTGSGGRCVIHYTTGAGVICFIGIACFIFCVKHAGVFIPQSSDERNNKLETCWGCGNVSGGR
jgi:hypothetical protein